MKSKFFVIILMICCVLTAFADRQGLQTSLPPGHWVYEAIRSISYEVGETSFSNMSPLSLGELKEYLAEIKYDELSLAGKLQYERVIDFIDTGYYGISSKYFTIGVDPVLSPEVFFKSNPNIDWNNDFYKQQKAITLPIKLDIADYISGYADFFIAKNYWAVRKHSNYTNIPFRADDIDMFFPSRAGISFGVPVAGVSFFNFQLGLGMPETCATQMGSVFSSPTMVGATHAQLSFFSPRIRYTVSIVQLEVDKYLYMHRIEGRPIKMLTIGLMEGVNVNAPLELRFLNPFAVFHNFSAWRDYKTNGVRNEDSKVGSYFGAYADINPWKYIRLYGIFVMNQFQTSYELNNFEPAKKIPNSFGYQLGIESWIPSNTGYGYVGFEAVYTNPWMYLNAGKDWSHFKERRENIGPDANTPIREWTGSPFGPDTIAMQIKGGYDALGLWSIYGGYRFKIHGEQNSGVFDKAPSYDSYFANLTVSQARAKTPTGIPEYTNTIFISAKWMPKYFLSIYMDSSLSIIANNKNIPNAKEIGFEISLGVQVKLPIKPK